MSYLVNANSCEWIELDRPLDLQRLRAAAEQVTLRHPVLNSVQVRRGTRYYWKQLDGPVRVDLRYRMLTADEAENCHAQLVDNAWQEQLPLETARPWRLHVTEAADGRTWLQIITSHVFTDGRSANIVARDLAAAYSAPPQSRTPDVEVQDGVRDPFALFTSTLPFRERLRLGLAAAAAIVRDALVPSDRLRLPRRARGSTGVAFFDFGQDTWESLRSAARGAGLSVHPLILGATLRTVEQLNAEAGYRTDRLRVIDNFSLRRFATSDDVHELYDVYAVPYTLDFDLTAGDAALVAGIRGQLDRMKRGEILRELYRQKLYMASSLLTPKKLATRMVARHIVRSNVICTNIGPVPEDFQHFGDAAVVDYYSFSQMFPPGEIMFLFSTYRSRLRLTLLYDTARVSSATADTVGRVIYPQLLASISRKVADA